MNTLTKAIRDELNSQDVYNFDAEAITDAVRVHMLSEGRVYAGAKAFWNSDPEIIDQNGDWDFQVQSGFTEPTILSTRACLSAAMGDQS